MSDLAPTTRLRFERRAVNDIPELPAHVRFVLQQWWAPNVPGYMRSESVGEWRDVPVVEAAP